MHFAPCLPRIDKTDKSKLCPQNLKYAAENESIYSQQSSTSRGLPQQRHLKNKQYPYIDSHLDSQYIATSHDGEFIASFNSDKFELKYYKTGNITEAFPINNNIQIEANASVLQTDLC
ncbi:3736_t:CDS:2 [Entrophospora sp. SA101]|nr:3736_t:CDS:2 [Entrophospora sp. SA101]